MLTATTEKYLKGKAVLFLFIITSCVYIIMLTITIPHVMTFSPGMPLLDMMPAGYSHEDVVKLFETLGEQGRKAYLTRQLPVDMIYPALFACTYALIFWYFIRKRGNLSSRWNLFGYLPLVAGACDYIENLFFITMLVEYPQITDGTVRIASGFSVAKSSSTTLYFLALTVLLISLGVKALRNRVR